MKRKIYSGPFYVFILIFLLLIISFNTNAQIPRQISLQGLLTNTDGSRIEDGALSIQFLIYESESGGTAKWTETQSIILKNSIFSTTLGKITPLDIPFDRPYWVGIRIMGNTELSPRIALTSSPYSLGGTSTNGSFPDGQNLFLKDSSNEVTHAFYTNGNTYHKGKGYFSGIVVGDSSKSFGDTIYTSLNSNYETSSPSNNTLEETSAGAKIGEGNIGLFGWSQNDYGVYGWSNKSYGLYGYSSDAAGVSGNSMTGLGVRGQSDEKTGVTGISRIGIGVLGTTTGLEGDGAGVKGITGGKIPAVVGVAASGEGVKGISSLGNGVYGKSTNKDGIVGESQYGFAGNFIGHVKIEKSLEVDEVNFNESLNKFLVWGDDKQVQWRNLPSGNGVSFNGILNNLPLSILNGSGAEVHRLNTDGTQTHSGLSTFNGGATGITVNSFGLKGESSTSTGVIGNSTSGIGVSGASVSNVGVKGYSKDQSGVWGLSTDNYGVTGESTNGVGVLGVSTNSTGILGSSDHGLAGKFVGKVKIEKTLEIDEVPNNESLTKFLVWNDDKIVYWRTIPSSGGSSFTGVLNNLPLSILNGSGTEVHRLNPDGTQTHSGLSTFNGGAQGISTSSFGLKGQSTSDMGIHGVSTSGHGVMGESETGSGVVGASNSSFGVFGQSSSGVAVMGSSQTNQGVSGYSNSGDAVVGQSVTGWSGRFTGKVKVGDIFEVDKVTNNESLTKFLVWGNDNIVYWRTIPAASSFDGMLHNIPLIIYNGTLTATHQLNPDGTQTHSGLSTFNGGARIPLFNNNYDDFSSQNGFRVMNPGGTTLAQICPLGNAQFGWVTKGGGSFKIDHPLDPENKYLSHSFVESPDMMNIYNGNVTLDVNGEATITLPDWFEALNKDFRYQLTCIGDFAQVYIAEEIHNNTFKIAGGKQGLKISWQVTGVRQDAYANAHRLKIEENKSSEERGTLLHPEAFGRTK